MGENGLIWFRGDLRVADNEALAGALRACETVTALFVLETDRDLRPMGAAARAWAAESLERLAASLSEYGIALEVHEGASATIVPERAAGLEVSRVFWGRRYGGAERTHDAAIKKKLEGEGRTVTSVNNALLAEPWTVSTKAGGAYGVFTPFWRALQEHAFEAPTRAPDRRNAIEPGKIATFGKTPKWARKVLGHWEPGEAGAKKALHRFIDSRLLDYRDGRDRPADDLTSQLSPHLRHGEISPRQIWFATRHAMDAEPALSGPGEKFLAELGWREFSYHLLYHREDIARVSMQEKFADMGWRRDRDALAAWQEGRTGIPIVDAGMRQLWKTGWMHNRVRMITASLLVKNMLVDWRDGEDWFWDTLVDADPANNPASWQWVAGTGADAAPYFRIFNPVTQGERFDAQGAYVARWVPELAALEGDKKIHAPWTLKPETLRRAEITLGETYPEPLVDLKASRKRALEAYGAA